MSEQKPKTIPDILEEVVEAICDNYCKYGDEPDGESLEEICDDCPLNKLI